MTAESLACIDASVSFEQTDALRGVNVEVAVGEKLAVVGPSGAGKSTLLALLAGVISPTTGSVRALGVDTSELFRRRNRNVRSQVAYIPQDFGLVGAAKVVTNVNSGRLGQWSTTRALRSLVQPQGLKEVEAMLQRLGLADRTYDRVESLSGGQQQRVAIAKALIGEPSVLLADEPISALDPGLAAVALDELLGLGPTVSLVASLHNPDVARSRFDRILGVRSGEVVFDLPVAEVPDELISDLYSLNDLAGRTNLTTSPVSPPAGEVEGDL